METVLETIMLSPLEFDSGASCGSSMLGGTLVAGTAGMGSVLPGSVPERAIPPSLAPRAGRPTDRATRGFNAR